MNYKLKKYMQLWLNAGIAQLPNFQNHVNYWENFTLTHDLSLKSRKDTRPFKNVN